MGFTGVTSHLRQVGAGELRRLCRSSVVRRLMVVLRMVVYSGLLEFLGKLLCQAASSNQYQRQMSCSTRTFHPEDKKSTRTSVYFDTNLVISARPARHEASYDVQLCAAPWHRLRITRCLRHLFHRRRGRVPEGEGIAGQF